MMLDLALVRLFHISPIMLPYDYFFVALDIIPSTKTF